ncbi:MAG: alpha/beta fold hydrolase [Sphingomonadales bacterium]|nr:MAG: alpha/beta fold hydrolase [Sphingomonadales bacterium]TNF05681.1 MAG: alpha/beta fold hydrolase [Sphingomonadales bacterium]
MTDIRTYTLPGFDGAALAVHEAGDEGGRPFFLMHGLFSSAQVNWIKYGHAATLAEAGFRVIMPDFRAHGMSAAPQAPEAYPDHVLVKDMLALIDRLDLTHSDFNLGGFSLGARTTAALLIEGVRPRKAVLAGMGLAGLDRWSGRSRFYLDAIAMRETVKRDDPHFMAVMFMKTMKIDPEAARLLLESSADLDLAALLEIDLPTGVICGDEDQDNGSAPQLAQALPDAHYYEVPGTHMSCIAKPELGRAIRDFLIG